MSTPLTIYLTQGLRAVVDAEDFSRLNAVTWYAWWNKDTQSYYVRRNLPKVRGKRGVQYMHRVVLRLTSGDSRQVDHVNHDTIDNRKSNLRVVTNRKNHENRRDQSKYGVGVYKRGKRFCARAMVEKRTVHIGTYDTPEEAQKAREKFLERVS